MYTIIQLNAKLCISMDVVPGSVWLGENVHQEGDPVFVTQTLAGRPYQPPSCHSEAFQLRECESLFSGCWGSHLSWPYHWVCVYTLYLPVYECNLYSIIIPALLISLFDHKISGTSFGLSDRLFDSPVNAKSSCCHLLICPPSAIWAPSFPSPLLFLYLLPPSGYS